MRLVIAEKPSVARGIAAEFGITRRGDGFIECGGTTVTWCFGHLLEQADPDAYTPDDVPRTTTGRKQLRQQDLPILPQTWILRPRHESKQQLGVIGRLLKTATEVVHAGDPDREGQLLVDEVLEHFRSKHRVVRLWLSAQDSVSIRRALQDLRENVRYAGMAGAARARQRADWLIGMNLSRAYTLRAQRGGGSALLTVGRVQTPTLALVVARDREIEAFTPRPYYTVEAHFEHPAGAFVASWKPKVDHSGLDDEDRLVDVQVANAIVAAVTGQVGSVASHVTEPKRKATPLCFALSDITVLASQRFGYSAEQVLHACQALYETHKLTSYPRTDCGYLPEAQHADARAVLAAMRHVNPELAASVDQADPTMKSPAWNDAKVTAHHGIGLYLKCRTLAKVRFILVTAGLQGRTPLA
jgi:DNA topoisomerase-3